MARQPVPGVLGSFIHIDAAIAAIRTLRRAGHHDLTVYSAAPNHEIEEALGTGSSWVRAFTLFGGLTGCAAGYECDTEAGCRPSGCACDVSGQWVCTADCGGGECMPIDSDP